LTGVFGGADVCDFLGAMNGDPVNIRQRQRALANRALRWLRMQDIAGDAARDQNLTQESRVLEEGSCHLLITRPQL